MTNRRKLSVSFENARAAASATLAAATAADGTIAVAVVDENGDPMYMGRMDGTPAADVQLAMRKAYTSAFIGRDTSFYHGQITKDGRTVADWADPMVTSQHGGVTLKADGQVIGGIGVSGSGDEDRDEQLASLGAATIA
jgi:glc operon protein GlcG